MATSTSQRFGIWVIAIVLTVGTLAGFIAMIIAPQNEANDQLQQQQDLAQSVKDQWKANEPLKGYEASSFDPAKVTKLDVEVLKKGTGKTAEDTSTVSANYFGWNSEGLIFDSTNRDGTQTPIDFGLDQVISGWTEGLSGQKAGSVVRLTIPADMAYGEDTGTFTGRPTGPLKFVVILEEVK